MEGREMRATTGPGDDRPGRIGRGHRNVEGENRGAGLQRFARWRAGRHGRVWLELEIREKDVSGNIDDGQEGVTSSF